MSEISSGIFLCWIWLFSLGVVPSHGITWLMRVSPSGFVLLSILAVSSYGRFLSIRVFLLLKVQVGRSCHLLPRSVLSGFLLGIRLSVVVQTVETVGSVHICPFLISAWVLENGYTDMLPCIVQ